MLSLFSNSLPLWDHALGFLVLIGCLLVLIAGDRTTPKEDRKGLWRAILISSFSGALLTFLGVVILKDYGWSLFVGLPVYCGLVSTWLMSSSRKQSFNAAVKVTLLTIVFLGFLILILAIDGVVCVLMAAPLAIPLAIGGAFLGDVFASWYRQKREFKRLLPIWITAGSLPFLVGFESRCDLPLPSSTVESSIDIAASPEEVWKWVPVIPTIPDRAEWIFRLGIAYPLESRMSGTGVGAQRDCVLSTGALKERITVWQPGHCLRFDVLSCPPSLRDISIYPNLHPAHLDNFYVSEWGEFKIIALDHGMSRLIGTSHYHNRMWPAEYWLPISDYIVHRIHARVLHFIKEKAENGVSCVPEASEGEFTKLTDKR